MDHGIRHHAQQLVRDYLRHFPEEHARLDALRRQLDAADDIAARSNMTGHLTSSAAVLNLEGTKLLLIDHRFLRMRLTPGGHYEPPGTLFESALREVAEETGVSDALAHAWTAAHGIPLDIDSHAIPANPRKNEGAHVHHDFLFVALAEESALQAQLDEVHAALWAPLESLSASPDRRQRIVADKLSRILRGAGDCLAVACRP